MDFIDKEILDYSENHTTAESKVLKELTRDTYANILMPRMLSGHLQGRLLSMFSKMISPTNILEIGTFTGYSAICLAEGLAHNGTLYTIEVNEELEEMILSYFEKAGISSKVKLIIGDALKIISELEVEFELVFIDAEKINYANYFNEVISKVKTGGYIIADNVLWSGKILGNQQGKLDKDTDALVKFNKFIQDSPLVENLLLPIRDGLMIMRKI
ncbi:MAG TPA: O-methyltransferase [Cytophagaceae bacterium]|jgi:predicted O-methyltransferase YrrM